MCSMSVNFVLLAALTVASCFTLPDIQCNLSDNECIKYLLNEYAPQVIAGIPSMDIPSADPLQQNDIQGNLFNLKYVLKNSTTEGFKYCRYVNVNSDPDTLSLSFEMLCPRFIMNGNYDLSGDLFSFPIANQGRYQIVTGLYNFNMKCNLEKVLQRDGRTSLIVKDFSSYVTPLEPVGVNFDNLFRDNRRATDFIQKFTGENWKALTLIVQNPVYDKNIQSVIDNVNKFLSSITVPSYQVTSYLPLK